MEKLKYYLVVFYFFYREKIKSEKSNVTIMLSNEEEEKRTENKTKEERKGQIIKRRMKMDLENTNYNEIIHKKLKNIFNYIQMLKNT